MECFGIFIQACFIQWIRKGETIGLTPFGPKYYFVCFCLNRPIVFFSGLSQQKAVCIVDTKEGPGLKSQLCHFLVVWLWASYLTSLSDIFCRMRIMILTLMNCWEDQMRDCTWNARLVLGGRKKGRRQLLLPMVYAMGNFLAGSLGTSLGLPNYSRDFWWKRLCLSHEMGGRAQSLGGDLGAVCVPPPRISK